MVFCGECGAQFSGKFCSSCGASAALATATGGAIEKCAGCGNAVGVSEDRVILSAKSWHRACYSKAYPTAGPKAGLQEQGEPCPGCSQFIVVGANTGEKTV